MQTGAIFPLTHHILTLIYCTLGSWLLPLGDVLFQNESHPSDEICMTSINGRLLLLLCDATKCINIVMKCVWRHCNVIRGRYSLLLRADFSISFANEWAKCDRIVAQPNCGWEPGRYKFVSSRVPDVTFLVVSVAPELHIFRVYSTTHNPVSN